MMVDILRTMKQKLYVLLGDVVQSRRISDRENFQDRVEETCKKINAMYVKDLYADFKILKGIDEIGGVLSDMSSAYGIIATISEELHPNSMRFALVFDYIDTALKTRNVTKMDGSAFHKASDMLHRLKSSKLIFDMSVGDTAIDTAIAGQVNLILLLKRNWSARQHQVVREYELTKNQSVVAENLGITQQAVSKILNRSMWKEIKTIEENLSLVLRNYRRASGTGCR